MTPRSLLAVVALAIAMIVISFSLAPILSGALTTITVTKATTQMYTTTTTTTVTTSETLIKIATSSTSGQGVLPISTAGCGANTSEGSLNISKTGLIKFASYEKLAQYLSKAAELSSYGTAYPVHVLTTVPTVTMPLTLVLESQRRAGISYSKTNVQVEGVDELDIAKTDGERVYFAYGDRVHIVDVKAKNLLSSVELPRNVHARGLFVYNDKLIVIATTPVYRILTVAPTIVPPPFVSPIFAGNTTVLIYDISNPTKPVRVGVFSVSGSYISSRLIGPYLYVITQLPSFYHSKPVLPIINGSIPPPSNIIAVGDGGSVYIVLSVVNIENLKSRSYIVLANPASRIYMTPKSLYIVTNLGTHYAYRKALLEIAQLLPEALRVEVEKQIEKGNEAKALEIIKEWLLSMRISELRRVVDEMNKRLENLKFSTISRVYRFSVNGLDLTLVGYSDIDGVVLDQFSMGEIENGKYFVIATTSREITYYVYVSFYMPSSVEKEQRMEVIVHGASGKTKTVTITIPPIEYPPSRIFISIYPKFRTTSNNVFVIDTESMKIVGELRDLAEGERIYAARIVGTLMFLVTFRRVDPLFAIDLSDPTKPRVLGFVKIPGYSEYLHPVAPGFLLGIGVDSSVGKPVLKISLFNATDPRNMEEIAKIEVPYGYTPALYDHHAITIDLDRKLLFIPIAFKWRTVGIAEITFANETLDFVGIALHSNALRALYIGNELFTVSPTSIMVFDTTSLKLLAAIDLKHR